MLLPVPTQLHGLGAVRGWTPILMLHEVVPDSTDPLPPYGITRSRLREILLDFSRRGYTSGTLDDVLNGAGRGNSISGSRHVGRGRKRLVLTFDDGTSDFLDNALPILQEFNFSATLFAVTGQIGGMRTWHDTGGRNPLTPVPLMSASDLRALTGMGFTVGSHTISHRPLPGLSMEEARREIFTSRDALSELLGLPVRWFAYPYLAANEIIRDLVREAGYDAACGGPNQVHSRFYLSRMDVSCYTTPQLRLRCNGLFHFARQTVREIRYNTRGDHKQVRSLVR